MDIKTIREVFGSMPLENLPAAQLMQQKSNRIKYILIGGGVCIVGGIVIGWYLANSYRDKND